MSRNDCLGHEMARVECDIEEALIEVNGKPVSGIVVSCERCGHEVEIQGYDTEENRRKALQLMRATCPEGERNRYVLLPTVSDQGKINMNSTLE